MIPPSGPILNTIPTTPHNMEFKTGGGPAGGGGGPPDDSESDESEEHSAPKKFQNSSASLSASAIPFQMAPRLIVFAS